MWPARYSPYDLAGGSPPPTWLGWIAVAAVTLAVIVLARDTRMSRYASGSLIVGAGMISVSIADASRIGLAVACVASAVTAILLARVMVKAFWLNLYFIAVWSLVFAGGALSLTTGWRPLSGTLIAALNSSAAAVVGGWAVLSARVVIQSKRIQARLEGHR